eukprot:GHVH01016482.1.p1 GENE.GHVH01016482.1~~GHVH01016482.1.p1  ORF type:complete len:334 (-),score=53.81 GHVH01016482.1:529-1530(-)
MDYLQSIWKEEIRVLNTRVHKPTSVVSDLESEMIDEWITKVDKKQISNTGNSRTFTAMNQSNAPRMFLHPCIILSIVSNTQQKPLSGSPSFTPVPSQIREKRVPDSRLLYPEPKRIANVPSFTPKGDEFKGFQSASDELNNRAADGDACALDATKKLYKAAIGGGERSLEDDGDLDPKLVPYQSLIQGEVTKEILSLVVNMKLSPRDACVSRDDIAGLDDLKKVIDRKVLFPMKRPDLAQGLQRAPRGVLLFGPPGTGKTTIARWIATEGNAAFFDVSPSSIMSKFVGETETIIKALFKVAAFDSPSVLFLDEIDAVLGKRKSSTTPFCVTLK